MPPWEKYQQNQDGPWNKYGDAGGSSDVPPIEEEQGIMPKIGGALMHVAESIAPQTTLMATNQDPGAGKDNPLLRAGKYGLAMLGDIGGAVERGVGTFRGYQMKDPQSHLLRPEIENLRSEGYEEGGAGGFGKRLGASALEVFAGDPTLALGIGKAAANNISAVAKTGQAIKTATRATVELPNKALGKLASELSGVSDDALRMYGTGFGDGAKQLKAAAGTERLIGEKLLDAVDDFDKFIPEHNAIKSALNNMEPINGQRIIDVLENAKKPGKLKQTRAANEQIDNLLDDVRGMLDRSGRIPAKSAFELRKEIDDVIGDAFGKESGNFVNAAKKARYEIKDALKESAEFSGNSEYVEAMNTLAKKMQLADDLKGYIGKSKAAQDRRVESFISNLTGKNSSEKQRVVKQLGELFGDDFLEQSKVARLAYEIGPGGVPAFTPRIFTGRSLLGAGLGFYGAGPAGAAVGVGLSSPRIAAGTLAAADAVTDATKTTGRVVEGTGDLARRYLPLLLGSQLQQQYSR